jgi:ribonuclease HI
MVDVYIDGSSIGNPGKISVGYLIYQDKKPIRQKGVYLGIGTNNFAEYMAVIFALQEVLAMGEKECRCFSDSNLLCEQLNGNYKVKNPSLYPLYILARTMISQLTFFEIKHIDREYNKDADRLAREATGFLV